MDLPIQNHDVSKLPKWVQKLINDLNYTIDHLQSLKKAHCVLMDRDWFNVLGPPFESNEDYRNLFIMNRNSANCICSLGKGDILLIGRAK